MRKRLVVETLHLDVEGGVGERRTIPSTSAAVDSTPHTVHGEIKDELQLAKVVIETPPERLLETTLSAADKTTSKKARKKVAFKTAETDLYDF
jgi:elongator complex protein 4